MKHILLQKSLFYSTLYLFWTSKTISHGCKTNIQSKTNHELTVGYVTASLDDIKSLYLECSWIVDLFEISSEVSLMIVLPLDESRNLICKLWVRLVASRSIHRTLVASF